MAEYYKWYEDQNLDEYLFPIPISMRKGKTIIAIRVYSRGLSLWQLATTYIPPAQWRSVIPITIAGKEAAYNSLKGQKGKIITKIFALRQ